MAKNAVNASVADDRKGLKLVNVPRAKLAAKPNEQITRIIMRRDMWVDCMYKMTRPPILAIMAGENRSSQAPASTGSPTARVATSKNHHERLFRSEEHTS